MATKSKTKSGEVRSSTESDLLSKLTTNIDRKADKITRKCKESFQYFSEFILGREDKPFHKSMRQMLQQEQRGITLFPRGFGKSTIILDYALWRICKNRDVRIIIATSAQRLGCEWLRELESQMLNNERLVKYFGKMVPERDSATTWTDTEKIVLGRSTNATHTTLYVVGRGGSILGKRADVILVDDIFEPEEGQTNDAAIQRCKDWFWKILYPICEPKTGCLFVSGTRFHQNDIYGDLIEHSGWPFLTYASLDEADESTWPERFPTDELKARRIAMGSYSFNLAYQNKVGDIIFSPDWLQTIPGSQIPELVIYQGIDPSFSNTAKSDFFSMFTIGVDEHHTPPLIYLLDLIHMRCSPMQQIEAIKKNIILWHPSQVGVETNSAQVLLKDELEEDTLWNIKGIVSTLNKKSRYMHMAALFEAGRIFMKGDESGNHLSCFNPFIAEWSSFPNVSHDDTLDALEKAVSCAVFSGPPAATGSKEDDQSMFQPRSRLGGVLFEHDTNIRQNPLSYNGRLFPSSSEQTGSFRYLTINREEIARDPENKQ